MKAHIIFQSCYCSVLPFILVFICVGREAATMWPIMELLRESGQSFLGYYVCAHGCASGGSYMPLGSLEGGWSWYK
jgi:hypothetical protein